LYVSSAEVLAPYFEPQNLVDRMLEYAASKEHIMDFTRLRVLTSMFALLNKGINNIITNASQLGNEENIQAYIVNHLIFSIMWGFGGSMALKEREAFSRHIQASVTIPTPDPNGPPLLGVASIIFTDNIFLERQTFFDFQKHFCSHLSIFSPFFSVQQITVQNILGNCGAQWYQKLKLKLTKWHHLMLSCQLLIRFDTWKYSKLGCLNANPSFYVDLPVLAKQ
jgi:hypothetical protein